MSRACVYLLNQNPIYRGIFSVSVRTLRKHNPDIPIILFYVEDYGMDNYHPSLKLAKHIGADQAKKYLKVSEIEIFDLCKELNIDLRRVKSPCQELNRYTPAHRVYLKEVKEESVLLLDSDTFIFGNIDSFFEKKSDFIADRMRGYSIPSDGSPPITEQISLVYVYEKNKNPEDLARVRVTPFNSGVVVFHKGTAAQYGEEILNYCNRLLFKKHPLSHLVHAYREDARNREEFACTLFVLENNLSWEYFEKSEVQTHTLESWPTIFHSTSVTWPQYFDAFAKQGLLVEN